MKHILFSACQYGPNASQTTHCDVIFSKNQREVPLACATCAEKRRCLLHWMEAVSAYPAIGIHWIY